MSALPGMNNLGMGFVLNAVNMASATFRQVQRDFRNLETSTDASAVRMRRTLSDLKNGFVLAGVGVIGLRSAFGLANYAGEFERGLAGVKAVTEATVAEMQKVRKSAIDAGYSMQFSPIEAVEGLKTLATAGQTATEATQTLVPVLRLAAGSLGELGMEGAAAAVVGTLNSYKLAATDATIVTDKLLRATQLTNFQTRDFEAGLAKAAVSGAIYKQPLNDVLVILGQLRNANIEASSASTGVREAFRHVGSFARAQNAILAQGVKVFEESTGKQRNMIDIMMDLTDKMKGVTEQEEQWTIQQAFGARGMLAFKAIQNATFRQMEEGTLVTYHGRDAIKMLRNELEQSTGTAEKFTKAINDNYAGQMQLLKASAKTTAVLMGIPFGEVLRPEVEALRISIEKFGKSFDVLPKPIQHVISAFLLLAFTTAALLGGFYLLRGGAVMLGLSFSGLRVFALRAAASLAVVLPWIAGIGGAVWLASFLVSRNASGMGDSFDRLLERTKLFARGFKQVWEHLEISGDLRKELNEDPGTKKNITFWVVWVERIKHLWDGLTGGFANVFKDTDLTPFIDGMVELGKAFGLTFSDDSVERSIQIWDLMHSIGGFIGSVFGAVAAIVVAAVGIVIRWVGMAVRLIAGGFTWLYETVSGVWDLLAGIFTGDWSRAWTGMKNIALAMAKLIVDIVMGMAIAIAGTIDNLAGVFGKKTGFADYLNTWGSVVFQGLNPAEGASAGLIRPSAIPGQSDIGSGIAGRTGFIQPVVVPLPAAASSAETRAYVARARRRVSDAEQSGMSDKQVQNLAQALVDGMRNVKLDVSLDGDRVGRAINRARRRESNEKFLSPLLDGAR